MRSHLLLPLVLCFGCGDDGGDAPIDAPPPLDAGDECNALVLPPTPVAVTRAAERLPNAGGGTVVPGSYVVTAVTVYTGTGGPTGPTGQTFQWRSVATATTFESIQRIVDGPSDMTTTQNGAYAVDGSDLSITSTCGGDPMTFTFDATPTSLTLYAGTAAFLFTKQ